MYPPENVVSQGRGEGWILKIAYFLEIILERMTGNDVNVRGICSYVCSIKQGRNKHVPYGELVGTHRMFIIAEVSHKQRSL
jgi:hypothetical protein